MLLQCELYSHLKEDQWKPHEAKMSRVTHLSGCSYKGGEQAPPPPQLDLEDFGHREEASTRILPPMET